VHVIATEVEHLVGRTALLIVLQQYRIELPLGLVQL
jgi:hypothetical protein